MTDTKISAMTAASSLGDTDELVLAVSGANKKITGANLKASIPSGGGELAYTEKTSGVSINTTSEASPTTIVTAAAITLSGSQKIKIDFFCGYVFVGNTALSMVEFVLYDGSGSIGKLGIVQPGIATSSPVYPVYLSRVLTPSSGSHTYSIRAYRNDSDGVAGAGAGGSGARMPIFIRITSA